MRPRGHGLKSNLKLCRYAMVLHKIALKWIAGWSLVLAAIAAGVWIIPSRPGEVRAAPAPEEAPPPHPAFHMEGAISCAAAACHNRQGPLGTKGSEYSTWLTTDPHRKAFNVLYNERSMRIEKNLHQGQASSAAMDRLCLGCHVHPELGPSGNAVDVTAAFVQDGVSCEGCHGAAGRWRTMHYMDGWPHLSDEEKQRQGMNPTKNLLVRAQTCAGCHVGSGDRDVNHDLIAAGHPRLTFAYSAYLAILPKHWDVRAEKARYPDLEARTWAVGQVASAQAALALLAYRADPRKPAAEGSSKAWPEFAEYNCFACHHALQGESWRQQPGHYHDRKPGALPWGTWYDALLSQAAGTDPQALSAVNRVREEMQKPLPDRAKVVEEAREAVRLLMPAAHRVARTRCEDWASLQGTFARIARDDAPIAAGSWDGAAQVYLALAALYNAEGDLYPHQRDPRVKGYLEWMSKELAFPSAPRVKYESPEEKQYGGREEHFLKWLEQLQRLE